MRNRFGNSIGMQRIERKRQFPGEYGRYLAMCPLQPSPFTPDFFIKPALLIKHALFYTTSNRIIKFLMIFLKSRRKSMTPLERQGSGAIVSPSPSFKALPWGRSGATERMVVSKLKARKGTSPHKCVCRRCWRWLHLGQSPAQKSSI